MKKKQIFEAEETNYEEDAETVAEIKAVQAEYEAGEYMTFDEYLESLSKQILSLSKNLYKNKN